MSAIEKEYRLDRADDEVEDFLEQFDCQVVHAARNLALQQLASELNLLNYPHPEILRQCNWVNQEMCFPPLSPAEVAECALQGIGPEGTSDGHAWRLPPATVDPAFTLPVPPPNPPELDPKAPMESARKFIAERHTTDGVRLLHRQGGTFYFWDGSAWPEIKEEALRAALYDYAHHSRMRVPMKQKDEKTGKTKTEDSVVPFHADREWVEKVLHALRAAARLEDDLQPPCWLDRRGDIAPTDLIACHNGLLYIPTRERIDHTPHFYNRNALDFGYDPKAPCPKWLAFLNTVWDDDPESVSALQELFGYLLTSDTTQQKLFMIKGPARSGKGTIARVLTNLLGKANVANPLLSSLGANFGLQPLIGKSVAIVSDARVDGRTDHATLAERLLSFSGEDSLTFDRKWDAAWTGQLGARFLIITNELPHLQDASGALARRFVIICTTRSFVDQEDTGLTDRLCQELPGILNWSLDGLERLRKRGHFVMPTSALAEIAELDELASPVRAFVSECCELGDGFETPRADLYEAWCAWCRRGGNKRHAGDVRHFGRDLRAAYQQLRDKQRRTDDVRTRVYIGIRLLPGARVGGEFAPAG